MINPTRVEMSTVNSRAATAHQDRIFGPSQVEIGAPEAGLESHQTDKGEVQPPD
jgi:hypothetical protein